MRHEPAASGSVGGQGQQRPWSTRPCTRLRCRWDDPPATQTPDAENASTVRFRCSRAWALAGCLKTSRCIAGGGSSADVDATQSGAVSVRRIRTLSSSGSSWDGVEGGLYRQFEAHGPAARKEAMACTFRNFPLIDGRPYRRAEKIKCARVQTCTDVIGVCGSARESRTS